ncbi:MAG: PAS domain S-box protein [Alphaproteobacteria bacterium]|nr:PAS domain S-box protein [Alphaproteobacteria bacterium]
MHKLLERQLRKCKVGDAPPNLDCLLDQVSRAYEATDSERRLRDRALDVLQNELEEINVTIHEEAEARFNVVMDNVGEAVVIIDQDGVIERFNNAAVHIFGYPPDEVIGQNIKILMPDDDASLQDDFLANYFDSVVSGIIGQGREIMAKRKNGEIFPIDLSSGELKGGDKRRFLGTIRDISLRKKVEIELRQSESRFRDLAGSASDWFWETDEDYKLSFVSERIGGILGVRPAAVLGHDYFELGLDDGDPILAAQHRSDIDAHLPFRDLVFHVGPVMGKDSKVVRISGLPVFDDHGVFLGYRGLGADISREMEAERRAKQAQQQLADAIESITEGIAVFGPDDRLLTCNSEYRRFFQNAHELIDPGLTFEQILLSGAFHQVVDTEAVAYEEWLINRLKHHQEATGEPLVMKTMNGRWVQSRVYRTSDGGAVNVRTDITQMKKREEELDALRRQYQLILDAADEGIIGLNPQGHITFANRVAGQMLGYDHNKMVGRCFSALVQPFLYGNDECLAPESAIARTFNEGSSHKAGDELFWRSDETNFHAEYLAAPIFDNEVVSGVVVVFRDVTMKLAFERSLADHQHLLEQQVAERTAKLIDEVQERRRTETALRDSQVRLKNISDSLFESILVINQTGHVVFANKAAKKMLADERLVEEMEGCHIDNLLCLLQDNACAIFDESPWRKVIMTAEILRDDDALFSTPSGMTLSVAYACSPLQEDKNRRSAILSFRDIADLKHAQREALHASRLASVGELAAGIAHEINTPIQYIGDNLRFIGDAMGDISSVVEAAKGLVKLAGENGHCQDAVGSFNKLTEKTDIDYLLTETPTAVRQSLDGVAQVARIVLSMKEFSHPGTGAKTMTDINRAIENTLVVSRNTWKHVAEMDWKPDPQLPQVACLPGEMNQVFLNVIVNAAHAIEGSGKKLPGRITITTAKSNDGYVEIRIQDSGTGVPDSIREKIYDPFFTTKGVGKGTGQGLAISRDVVVTKHGGQLQLESREGEGAVFIIKLPINEPGGTPQMDVGL